MNTCKKYLFALVGISCAALTSCEKDGDLLYANAPEDAVLNEITNDIVLSYDNLDALALTIYWNENGDITLSDPSVKAPENANANTLQFASDENFTNMVEENITGGVYYRQYTCQELNNLLTRIGFEGGVKAPLYVRLKSVLGANIEAKYSNTAVYNVTTYFIDMSIAYYLLSDHSETGRTLYSPSSNGVYSGFIGANGWENWWLREGNNVEWGNDGVEGTPFKLGNNTTGLELWNFWYPGLAGCYYTIVDTPNEEWSALYIPELTIGGDLSGTMTFDRKSNAWNYTFNAEARSYNITLSGVGKQYNINTGTDDAAAIATPVAFWGDATALTFGSNAVGSVTVNVENAGETTIVLDLSDPTAWSLTAQSGGAIIETTAPELFLSGVYGEWTFDYSLKLYNEDYLTYGGVLPVSSQWGYKMYVEANNWDDYYSMVDGGTAYEGMLEAGGANNFIAPAEPLCLFDVSLSALTYKVIPVSSVSFTGVNDDWSLRPMTATDTPWIYTGEFEKTGNTPWGVKVIINEDWGLYFGKCDNVGQMRLYNEGFEGDNDLETGKTYVLTVDFVNSTYTYTAK